MDGTTTETGARGDREGWSAGGRRGSPQEVGSERGLSPWSARIALGLGLFSVGLGLAELLAPRRILRLAGIGGRSRGRALTRAFGVRELVAGLGLLGRRRVTPWLWARVIGDAVDLAALAAGARRRQANVKIARVAGTIAAVAGVTALDIYAAIKARGRERAAVAGPVQAVITIAVTPERAYRFWRDLQNLPAFMTRLDSVYELDERRSRWHASLPAGRALEWEGELVEDRPNECIAWRSVADSDVTHGGEVRFRAAPGGRGAEIRVQLAYVPPAGELGRVAAWFSNQALKIQLENDLRRLKQLLEVGEVVHSDASIHRGRHPAQPARS
jgi:uncharacterized membrane protein